MSMQLIAYPLIIQKQSTAPSINSNSVLWRDTDDNVLYFSDGTSWQQFSSSTESQGWEENISQLILEILRLSAEGTLTAPDYDNMFVDYMADADGQDGTIDTGNTTAIFSGNNYVNGGALDEASGFSETSSSSENSYQGFKIYTNRALTLLSVTKVSNCDATRCLLLDSSKTPIGSPVNFVGDTATFTADNTLTTDTNYYVVVDDDGASFTRRDDTGFVFPTNKTYINYITGIQNGGTEVAYGFCIESIETTLGTPSDLIVQTNAQVLDFVPTYILIHVKDITENGTSAVSFDVSFDGGSTWDSTDNTLNSKRVVVDGSSKNMVIKLNLDGTGAGNSCSIKDYEAILWSS